MSRTAKRFFEFDSFRLDPAERQLLREANPVPLTPKAFGALVVFVENSGRLLTKEELLRAVWGEAIVEENSLDKAVSVLRKTLGGVNGAEGGAAGRKKYIETVRGHGYRFIADVKQIVEDDNSEAGNRETPPATRIASESVNERASQLYAIQTAGHALIAERGVNIGSPSPIANAAAALSDISAQASVAASRMHERNALTVSAAPAFVAAVADNAPRRSQFKAFKTRKVGALVLIVSAFLIVAAAASAFWMNSRSVGKFHRAPGDMTTERLTNGGDIHSATISPDGKFFVYEEREGEISHLRLRQTGQGTSLEIAPPAERYINGTAISPDEAFVYYTVFDKENADGVLYRTPTLGGAQTKLLTNIRSSVTFSPDVGRIAFVRRSAETNESFLVVASSSGEGERVLLARSGRERLATHPAWSPDGRQIAVGLWTSATRASDTFCKIFGVDVQTGAVHPLAEQKWDQCGRIAWTSDEEGFVLIGTKQGEALRRDEVFYVTQPEGEALRITTGLSRHYLESLGVTADGVGLIVVPFERTSQIWAMDAQGDACTAVQLTGGASDGKSGIAALPDGSIVYLARTGDAVNVWRMNADGTEQKQLTNETAFLEELHATPDGRFLVFASKRSGRTHLFRADADGSNIRQLTFGDNFEIDSDISPDGQWVVYASQSVSENQSPLPWTLWKISIDGGSPIQLTGQPSNSPHFSPDGKYISCVAADRNGHESIAIISAQGGAPLKTFEPIKNAALNMGCRWTVDGQNLTYLALNKNAVNIWLQPISGDAPPRPLTDFKDGEIYNYAFSQDGSRLLLARGHQIHDALLIRNFR